MKKFQLNTLRRFDSETERREYFSFSNGEGNYEMNDHQMTQFEDAIIRKIVKKIFHSM